MIFVASAYISLMGNLNAHILLFGCLALAYFRVVTAWTPRTPIINTVRFAMYIYIAPYNEQRNNHVW